MCVEFDYGFIYMYIYMYKIRRIHVHNTKFPHDESFDKLMYNTMHLTSSFETQWKHKFAVHGIWHKTRF